ncbi:MAG: transposase [Rhodocyclaceae bacterium]|nr:transposase [Rhodocyclaceae bacterium]
MAPLLRAAWIGAVAFIHRFGSILNEHVHFSCCIIDGVVQLIDDRLESCPDNREAIGYSYRKA